MIEFGGLTIRFDGNVLAPRPWTLEQSRWAIEVAADVPDGAVLELCAGVGQIGLVVGRATGRLLVQVDVDERACALARANAADAHVDSDVRCGDAEAVLADGERFPLVLADPPYIPSGRTDRYDGDPELAIDGGDDGLELARRCLRATAVHLTDDGRALLQLGGPAQAHDLAREVPSYGLAEVERRTYGEDRSLVLLRRA